MSETCRKFHCAIENGMGLRELNPREGVGWAAGQRGLPPGSSYAGDQSAAESAQQAEGPSEENPWGGALHVEKQFKNSWIDLIFSPSMNAKKVTKHYLQ